MFYIYVASAKNFKVRAFIIKIILSKHPKKAKKTSRETQNIPFSQFYDFLGVLLNEYP